MSDAFTRQVAETCARLLADETVAEATAADLIAGADLTRETLLFVLPVNLTKSGREHRWTVDTPPDRFIRPSRDPITDAPE
jgi:hypothetical protein